MNKTIAFIFSILMLTLSETSFAQNVAINQENATILHQNGQIYLVVLVLVTIFAGIIFYLIRLERKLNRLEKK
ncbi:MAG: CcmD family protein [Bacteroidetes bacterium]|nr:CcmD family protein [Bacteroidota bacterium]